MTAVDYDSYWNHSRLCIIKKSVANSNAYCL